MSRLAYYLLLCSCSCVVLGVQDIFMIPPKTEPPAVSATFPSDPTVGSNVASEVLRDGPSFASTHVQKKTTSTMAEHMVMDDLKPTSSPSPTAVPPTTPPTTTTAPTSTTTAPTSTTTAPTSTTTAPTTTTTAPTTTTTAPAPAPKPTPPGPLPPPDQGTWWYTYPQTNITCIVVQFAAQLNITYTKSVENKTSLAYTLLNVPLNASVVDGSCAGNDSRQWIALGWPAGGNATNKMALYFARNDTTKNYMIQSLNVSLSADQFLNASSNATIEVSHSSLWLTPLATSYRCAVPTRLNLTADAGSSAQAGVLTVSRLQEEAFRNAPGRGFSAARECGGGDVPDAVPIAVGCALGGLVVVVLVAYLLGRRRSAARGYLSM